MNVLCEKTEEVILYLIFFVHRATFISSALLFAYLI